MDAPPHKDDQHKKKKEMKRKEMEIRDTKRSIDNDMQTNKWNGNIFP